MSRASASFRAAHRLRSASWQEELPDDEGAPDTGNAAIDAAVRVLQGRANPPGDARFVQKWCKVPRDVKLLRAREFSGRLMYRLGWVVVVTWFLIVGGLLTWVYLDSKIIVLQLSPMDVLAVDYAPLQNVQDTANAIVDNVGEKYPPNASGFARIWPWNWEIEPVIPIESDAAYWKLTQLTRFGWDPYEMIKNPGPFLERLPSETDHSMIITLELAFLDLKESLPNVDRRISVIKPTFGHFLAIGLTVFFILSFFLTLRFSISGARPVIKDSALLPIMQNAFRFSTFIIVGLMSVGFTIGESFERLIPCGIAVAFMMAGFTFSTIQWPRNPLMKTIKDLEPPDQEEEEEEKEIKERKKRKKDSER